MIKIVTTAAALIALVLGTASKCPEDGDSVENAPDDGSVYQVVVTMEISGVEKQVIGNWKMLDKNGRTKDSGQMDTGNSRDASTREIFQSTWGSVVLKVTGNGSVHCVIRTLSRGVLAENTGANETTCTAQADAII